MMNLSTQAQDVEPFLAASRSSDPTSRRCCGAIAELQTAHAVLCHVCLMAGKCTGSALIDRDGVRVSRFSLSS